MNTNYLSIISTRMHAINSCVQEEKLITQLLKDEICIWLSYYMTNKDTTNICMNGRVSYSFDYV